MEQQQSKTISFNTGMNFYHTKNEKILKVENGIANGEAIIAGHTKENLCVDDILNIGGVMFKVVEILQNRDHKGVFNDENNKGSFFEVKCNFTKIVEVK